jgi:hypothetical protein
MGTKQQQGHLERSRVEGTVASWIRVALCFGAGLFVALHSLSIASAQANASQEQVVSISHLGDPCDSSGVHHEHATCVSSAACSFSVVLAENTEFNLLPVTVGATFTPIPSYTDQHVLPRLPPPKLLGSA